MRQLLPQIALCSAIAGADARALSFSPRIFARVLHQRYGLKGEGRAVKKGRGGAFVSFCAVSAIRCLRRVGWWRRAPCPRVLHFRTFVRVGCASLSLPYKAKTKGYGTPTDAVVQPAVLLARPRLQQKAHAYRRSTAALPWGISHRPGATSGHASWDVGLAPNLSHPPSEGRSLRSFCGRYPPSPVPVQRAPRSLVCSARTLMPEAARERLATPPAGTALAPEPRHACAAGPFTERESRIVM